MVHAVHLGVLKHVLALAAAEAQMNQDVSSTVLKLVTVKCHINTNLWI